MTSVAPAFSKYKLKINLKEISLKREEFSSLELQTIHVFLKFEFLSQLTVGMISSKLRVQAYMNHICRCTRHPWASVPVLVPCPHPLVHWPHVSRLTHCSPPPRSLLPSHFQPRWAIERALTQATEDFQAGLFMVFDILLTSSIFTPSIGKVWPT